VDVRHGAEGPVVDIDTGIEQRIAGLRLNMAADHSRLGYSIQYCRYSLCRRTLASPSIYATLIKEARLSSIVDRSKSFIVW